MSALTGGASAASYTSGFMPQMILGEVLFSLNSAAFQELNRETAHRWSVQERFGQPEALQYIGPGSDTITLPGVIYPSYRGGTGQIEKMRNAAAKGEPLQLIDGFGNVLGRWVIESVSEKRTNFAALGVPRKQEFTMKLRHFDGGSFNSILQMITALF